MNFNLLEIDGILVNKDILNVKFTCNLSQCKGACCTLESEYGAPVTKEEIEIIERIFPVVKEYLPELNKRIIEKDGFYEEKSGDLLLKSINNRECVFAYYDGDIAKCAIERAYREGKVDFPKPLSCHLFPIRVSEFGGDVLRFEKYNECQIALEYGQETGLTVAEFCKDSLIRAYGKEWYGKLINNLDS